MRQSIIGITHVRGFESLVDGKPVYRISGITHGRGFESVWWSGTSRLLEDEEWALSWVSERIDNKSMGYNEWYRLMLDNRIGFVNG